jgi:glutamate synthase domain-containing protein 2
LDRAGKSDVSLIITGGLRTPVDFIKALAFGADGIFVSNSVLLLIDCLGLSACDSNNCPIGIATQKANLRERLMVDQATKRLGQFFNTSIELMQLTARAGGYQHLN